jgi:hypothetical protein
MTAYNSTRFDPPAPVAYVTLQNETTGAKWSNVPMLLDSGADVSLIPQAAVDKLGLTHSDKRYELTGFDDSVISTPAAQLELGFCRRIFRGKFLLIDQDLGIIGRDILNLVSLLFDGPHLEWGEFRPEK